MDAHEQKVHSQAVERFVDVTLNGVVGLLRIVEADMALAEAIPREDAQIYVTVAARVYLGLKLFEGYGATMALNEHVRRVVMAPGRQEVNDDINNRLERAGAWLDKRCAATPALAKMVRDMGWVSKTAALLYKQDQQRPKP